MNQVHPAHDSLQGPRGVYFSRVFRKPVRLAGDGRKLGPASDIVFALAEPFPRAVGVYIDHGWGVPSEFVPWDKVVDVSDQAIIVRAPDFGDQYPPFQDQAGWILADKHLMGRTILDIDDRKTEVVNDVLLRADDSGFYLAAVDASFNGFLRKWGLQRLTSLIREDLIPWKFVQPLSLEDAIASDRLQLSVTKEQLHDLPKEDLADALEELTGQEQEALFSALETNKAAETLTEAEPRAQRQIIAGLRQEQASLQQIDQTLVVNVRTAVRAVETSEQRVGIFTQATELAVKQYELHPAAGHVEQLSTQLLASFQVAFAYLTFVGSCDGSFQLVGLHFVNLEFGDIVIPQVQLSFADISAMLAFRVKLIFLNLL